MSSIKPSSRYATSFDARSSTKSDPSSSTELNSKILPSRDSSHALVKSKHTTSTTNHNFTSLVKHFVQNPSKTKQKSDVKLLIPADFIAEDLKKTARKGTSFSGLHKKLFKGVKKEEKGSEKKALTEVKGNTRTLAMVLRSERELLSMNKEQETQITELKLILEGKNREVEKLKDLCLKQREEIKSLKNAILFPDVMNSQLQELLEKQGSELKQAKQLIPSLQRQVTSLTGQLQCLAEDLAEVKADKYSVRGFCDDHVSSPRTPVYDQEEAANSLEFSSGDQTTPGSPDDMFLKDLNPCLTPYYAKTKSKEFEEYDSPDSESISRSNLSSYHEGAQNPCVRNLSKSSDCCKCTKTGSRTLRAARRSDESKCAYGKRMDHKLF